MKCRTWMSLVHKHALAVKLVLMMLKFILKAIHHNMCQSFLNILNKFQELDDIWVHASSASSSEEQGSSMTYCGLMIFELIIAHWNPYRFGEKTWCNWAIIDVCYQLTIVLLLGNISRYTQQIYMLVHGLNVKQI